MRIFVFILMMLSTLCAPTFAQTCTVPGFTQPPVYPVGADVRSVATADFDGDGHPDLAVANADSSTVTVLKKVGQGKPAVINTYAVGEFPLSVAAADFTGDGKPDIISVNNAAGNMSLLRNNGFGGFVLAGTFNTGGGGVDIAVGDFNNNGTLDVAVAMGNGVSNVSILLGDGQGSFSAPASFLAPADQIVAADFNNDGKLDLAIVGNATQIRLGNGAGQFTAAPCSVSSNSGGLAAGDVNGDGKLDLVRANRFFDQIQIYPGDGAGCLGASTNIRVLYFGRPGVVTLRDLNKDGKLDIVAGATVLINNGSGDFGPPFAFGLGSLGADPGTNTVVADFDGDSNLDIASASGGSAGILFGDGAGGFRLAVGQSSRGAFGLARADLNNDGKQDVVVAVAGGFAVMLGDGNGNFGTPSTFMVPGAFVGPVIADFNGDTKLDVAGYDRSNTGPGGLPRLQVVLGDGLGGFGSTISTSFDSSPGAISGGDLNGDGKTDLVTVNSGGGNNNEGSISIGLSDGAGHFTMQPNVSVPTAVNPLGPAFADFNKDGKTDLAVPSGFGFSILLGNGAGGFAPRTHITTANSSSIRAADLNADGNVDLAMISAEPNGKASVVLGNGLGGFGAPQQFNLGFFPSDLTVTDFNNDGKPDLAVVLPRQEQFPSPQRSNIAVLLGDGIGAFGPPVNILAERSASRIIAADLTGDARPDIIAASDIFNNLTVALNTCGSPPPTTFTISGAVKDGSNKGIAEVAMILVSDVAEPQIALTDGNGDYAFAYAGNLSHNLRVTPSKSGYSFNPLAIVFTSSSSVTGDKIASFTGTLSATPPAGQIPILLTRDDSQHALALDSVTWTIDPFSITNIHNFSADQRTRITLFAVNVDLGPGETSSVIEAQAEVSGGQTFPLTVEYFGAVPNLVWLKQIIVKLPTEVSNGGDIRVTVKVRGTAGNTVIVKVQP